jgi:hypothetical protein
VFSGVTVVTNARAYYHHTRGCGRIGARHSLRPLTREGGKLKLSLAQDLRRDRESVSRATSSAVIIRIRKSSAVIIRESG